MSAALSLFDQPAPRMPSMARPVRVRRAERPARRLSTRSHLTGYHCLCDCELRRSEARGLYCERCDG